LEEKNVNFPSFGTKTSRELKLLNEDTKNNPGPGKYNSGNNLKDLLKNCEDKDLVEAILETT
jgi:hypothetical protein